MKKNIKLALFVSLFGLIGIPVLFFFISIFTEQWNYLIWSIPPSLTAGLTGLMITLQQLKKENNGS